MFSDEWIVTRDTPEKNNPLTAFVLCVVKLSGYPEYRKLGDKLMKENMHAFRAKTFGKYFWSRVEKPEAISYDEFAAKLEEPGWLHSHE